jgi:hypothetical protein
MTLLRRWFTIRNTIGNRPRIAFAAILFLIVASVLTHYIAPSARVVSDPQSEFISRQFGLRLINGHGGAGTILVIPHSLSNPGLVRVVDCPKINPANGICIRVK